MLLPFTLISGQGLGYSYSSLNQQGELLPGKVYGQAKLKLHVNLASGNIVIDDPLCRAIEVDMFLPLQMIYNSHAPDKKSAWRYAAQKTLRKVSKKELILTESDGHETSYMNVKIHEMYHAPGHGEGSAFIQVVNNNPKEAWVWREPKTGACEYYNKAGQLIRHLDRKGLERHYRYEKDAVTVIGPSGTQYRLQRQYVSVHQRNPKIITRYTLYKIKSGDTFNIINTGQYEWLRHYYLQDDGLIERTEFPDGYTISYRYHAATQIISNIEQTDGTILKLRYGHSQTVKQQLTTLWLGARGVYDFRYNKPLEPYCSDRAFRLILTLDENARIIQKQKQYGMRRDTTSYEYTDGQYWQQGQIKKITHVDGSEEHFDYHEVTRLLTKYQGPNGQLKQHHYEESVGYQHIKITDVNIVGDKKLVTRYLYDFDYKKIGRERIHFLKFTLSPGGGVTEYQPNTSGDIARTIKYLAGGYRVSNIADFIVPLLSSVEDWATQYHKKQLPVSVTDFDYDPLHQKYRTRSYASTDINALTSRDTLMQDLWEIREFNGDLTHRRRLMRGEAVQLAQPDYTHYSLETFKHDSLHRLQNKSDPLDNQTHYEHNDSKQAYTEILPNDYRRTQVMDKSDRLITTIEQGKSHGVKQQRQTDYVNDWSGNRQQTTRPDGENTYVYHNRASQPVLTVSVTGITTQIIYDPTNRLTTTIRYADKLDLVVYEQPYGLKPDTSIMLGAVEEQKLADNPDNRISYQIEDASGRERYTIDAGGYIHETRYDELDREIINIDYAQAITPAELRAITSKQALSRQVDPSKDRINQTFYTDDDEILAQKDPEGYITHNIYDRGGRLRKRIRYAIPQSYTLSIISEAHRFIQPPLHEDDIHEYYFRNGLDQIECKVDGEGYLDSFIYYPHGGVKQHTRHATPVSPDWYKDTSQKPALPASSPEDVVTKYDYDKKKRPKLTSSSAGRVEIFDYDVMDNVIKTTIYDAQNPDKHDADHRRLTATRYNSWQEEDSEANVHVGQLLLEANGDAKQEETVWDTQAAHHTYNDYGLKLSSHQALMLKVDENPTRCTTIYYYDIEHRLSIKISPAGAVIETSYNNFNEEIRTRLYVTLLKPEQRAQLTGGLRNDVIDTLIASIADDKKDIIKTKCYEHRGLVSETTDGEGVTVAFTHNGFREVIKEIHPIDIDKPNLIIGRHYSPRGLEEKITKTADHKDAPIIIKKTKHDNPLGLPTQEIDPLGKVTVLAYNRLGWKKSTLLPGQSTPTIITYNAFGVLVEINPLGDETWYIYDQTMRTLTTHYPEEDTLRIETFNVFTEKVSECGALNCMNSWTHAPDGQVAITTNALGYQDKNTYNTQGWLLRSINKLGKDTHIHLNLDGFILEQIRDFFDRHLCVLYERDAIGREKAVTEPGGIYRQNTFDRNSNKTTSIIDPDDKYLKNVTGYNKQGTRTSFVKKDRDDNKLSETKFLQDLLGRSVAEEIDPEELRLRTENTLDPKGRVKITTDPRGKKSYTSYDARDNVRFKIDPCGGVNECTYDDLDQICSRRVYAVRIDIDMLAKDQSEETIRQLLRPSQQDSLALYFYDGNQRERFTIRYGVPAGSEEACAYVTEKKYDLAGRKYYEAKYKTPLTDVKDVENWTLAELEQAVANIQGQGAKEYYWRYDAADKIWLSIDPRGAATQFHRDEKGRIITQHKYAQLIDNLDSFVSLTDEDAKEKLETHATDEDRITQTYFNVFDKPEYIILPDSSAHYYHHDDRARLKEYWPLEDRCTSTTDRGQLRNELEKLKQHHKENDQSTRIVKNEWNSLDYKTAIVDPTDNREEFKQNLLGNLIKQCNRAGQIHEFDYDGAKRMRIETAPARDVYTTSLKDGKVILSGPEHRVVKTKTDYDENDNPIKKIKDYEGDSPRSIINSYDDNNNLQTTTIADIAVDDPDKKASFDTIPVKITDIVIKKAYNGKNQVICEQDGNGACEYTIYDSFNRKAYTINKNGAVTSHHYDAFDKEIITIRYANCITIDAESAAKFAETEIPVSWLKEHLIIDPENDLVTKNVYDGNDNNIRALRPQTALFDPWERSYALARPTDYRTFNVFNECIEEETPHFPESKAAQKLRWYDKAGHIVAVLEAMQTSEGAPISYKAIRSYYTIYGEEKRRHEYGKPLKEVDPSWSLKQLDAALKAIEQLEGPEKDNIKSFEYDELSQLKSKTSNDVIRQKSSRDADGKPQMSDVQPRNLTDSYQRNALGQKTSHTNPNNLEEKTYYGGHNKAIAHAGVPREILDEKEAIPVTYYYHNAHEQEIGLRRCKQAALTLPKNDQTPDVKEDPNDRLELSCLDNRGCRFSTMGPEGDLHIFTHDATRKEVREYWRSEGYEQTEALDEKTEKASKVNLLVQRIDEKRTIRDPMGHITAKKLYRDGNIKKTERTKYDAFGEAIAEGDAEQWPLYRITSGECVWLSNDDKGIPTITLHDAKYNVTATIQSATIDLSTKTPADLEKLFSDPDNENIELYDITLYRLGPRGKVLEQVLPAHLGFDNKKLERVEIQMQVGNDNKEEFGEVNISWRRIQDELVTPKFFIWHRQNNDNKDERELPVMTHGQRRGVDVSQFQTGYYNYEIRYYLTDEEGEQQRQLYETVGQAAILTQHTDQSIDVVPVIAGPALVTLHGATKGLYKIDLYQEELISTKPVVAASDGIYYADLSTEQSGSYRILPRFADGSLGTLAPPLTIYTTQPSPTPLPRQLNFQAELRTLQQFGELSLRKTLPTDYQDYAIKITCNYLQEDDEELQFHEAILYPDTNEGDHIDDNGDTLKANIKFPSEVSVIESLKITLIRDPNVDEIILYLLENLSDEEKEDEWTLLDHENVIKAYQLSAKNFILIEPVPDEARASADMHFFDTSLDRGALWRHADAVDQLSQGLVFDFSNFPPGVYPYILAGEVQERGLHQFSLVQNGAVYASAPGQKPSAITINASRKYEYDVWANQTEIIDADGHTTNITYNDVGAPIQVLQPEMDAYEETGKKTPKARPQLQIGYDTDDNEIGRTDGAGAWQVSFWDTDNHLMATVLADGVRSQQNGRNIFGDSIRFTDANNRIWVNDYNKNSQVIRMVSPSNYRTLYNYSVNGLRIKTQSPGNLLEYFNHTVEGFLQTHIDSMSYATRFEYHHSGAMSKKQYADGLFLSWIHDYFGNLAEEQLLNKTKITHTRDYKQQMTRTISVEPKKRRSYRLEHTTHEYTQGIGFKKKVIIVSAIMLKREDVSGQDLRYDWSNGQIVKIEDAVQGMISQHGYNNEGYRTLVRLLDKDGGLIREMYADIDGLGRETHARDGQVELNSGYSLAGSRVFTKGIFHGEDGEDRRAAQWHSHNPAKKVLIDGGRLKSGKIEIVARQGLALTYQGNERATETSKPSARETITQTLGYDDDGRLETTIGSNKTSTIRKRDARGFVRQHTEEAGYTLVRTITHDNNGNVKRERVDKNKKQINLTGYDYNEIHGVVVTQKTNLPEKLSYEFTTEYHAFRTLEAWRVSGKTSSNDGDKDVTPAVRYFDANRNMITQRSAVAPGGALKTTHVILTPDGLPLRSYRMSRNGLSGVKQTSWYTQDHFWSPQGIYLAAGEQERNGGSSGEREVILDGRQLGDSELGVGKTPTSWRSNSGKLILSSSDRTVVDVPKPMRLSDYQAKAREGEDFEKTFARSIDLMSTSIAGTPIVYTVGDQPETFAQISQAMYNDPGYAQMLAQLNGMSIEESCYAGMRVKLLGDLTQLNQGELSKSPQEVLADILGPLQPVLQWADPVKQKKNCISQVAQIVVSFVQIVLVAAIGVTNPAGAFLVGGIVSAAMQGALKGLGVIEEISLGAIATGALLNSLPKVGVLAKMIKAGGQHLVAATMAMAATTGIAGQLMEITQGQRKQLDLRRLVSDMTANVARLGAQIGLDLDLEKFQVNLVLDNMSTLVGTAVMGGSLEIEEMVLSQIGTFSSYYGVVLGEKIKAGRTVGRQPDVQSSASEALADGQVNYVQLPETQAYNASLAAGRGDYDNIRGRIVPEIELTDRAREGEAGWKNGMPIVGTDAKVVNPEESGTSTGQFYGVQLSSDDPRYVAAMNELLTGNRQGIQKRGIEDTYIQAPPQTVPPMPELPGWLRAIDKFNQALGLETFNDYGTKISLGLAAGTLDLAQGALYMAMYPERVAAGLGVAAWDVGNLASDRLFGAATEGSRGRRDLFFAAVDEGIDKFKNASGPDKAYMLSKGGAEYLVPGGLLAKLGVFKKGAKGSGVGLKQEGLGANPFKGKTFAEIDEIFTSRGFKKIGPDPISGRGSYFHPKSGRKYYLDKGGVYKAGVELPHVDVHRISNGINLEKTGKHRYIVSDNPIEEKLSYGAKNAKF